MSRENGIVEIQIVIKKKEKQGGDNQLICFSSFHRVSLSFFFFVLSFGVFIVVFYSIKLLLSFFFFCFYFFSVRNGEGEDTRCQVYEALEHNLPCRQKSLLVFLRFVTWRIVTSAEECKCVVCSIQLYFMLSCCFFLSTGVSVFSRLFCVTLIINTIVYLFFF